MFTPKNIDQMVAHGVDPQKVNEQLAHFQHGFPFLNINRAATPGDGIILLQATCLGVYEQHFNLLRKRLKIIKMVPASGAATRMFKDLYEFLYCGVENHQTRLVLDHLDQFAFADSLKAHLGENRDPKEVIETLVGEEGLGYGCLPKALLLFHRYGERSRTALEEHLVEGALYATGRNATAKIHFTLSPEHQPNFEALVAEVVPLYELRFGVRYEITYSHQKSSTDTLAVTSTNEPFQIEDGSLLFRPAGHGALLENLNDLGADLIFIKTIDNVVPDRLKADTIQYKAALAGLMLTLQGCCFEHLKRLEQKTVQDEELTDIAKFLETELGQRLPDTFYTLPPAQQSAWLFERLNRPIRVCGMVKNEGEPGGGPFWVRERDGSESLQIAESSQIDPQQAHLMAQATHFNPVDLVCGTKNYKGEKFDLHQFCDPETGFISLKSREGRDLKALELPGLWNGAMAQWNTVFVEVPTSTFAPVKVVGDLLKEHHQNSM